MITVEKFAKEHVPFAAKIEKECFSAPWSENALESELENENARFYVAFVDGEAAGYFGMHVVCGEGYVANIAVDKKFRRLGVAGALLNKAAEENKMSFISLEVRKSNAPAISFYKKHGFETVGERKKFYSNPSEDAFIMTKYFKNQEKV